MFGSQEQMCWSNPFSGSFGEEGGNSRYRVTQEPASCIQLQLLGLLGLQAPFALSSHAGELQSKHQKQCQIIREQMWLFELYTVLMCATLKKTL